MRALMMAVGAMGAGKEKGAVFILYMNRDGTVKRTATIASLQGQSPAYPPTCLPACLPYCPAYLPTYDLPATPAGLSHYSADQLRSCSVACGGAGWDQRLSVQDHFGHSLRSMADMDGTATAAAAPAPALILQGGDQHHTHAHRFTPHLLTHSLTHTPHSLTCHLLPPSCATFRRWCDGADRGRGRLPLGRLPRQHVPALPQEGRHGESAGPYARPSWSARLALLQP